MPQGQIPTQAEWDDFIAALQQMPAWNPDDETQARDHVNAYNTAFGSVALGLIEIKTYERIAIDSGGNPVDGLGNPYALPDGATLIIPSQQQ